MPDRSTRPDAVRGAGADMFTLPSGPSGRPSLEMFFHCAATGIEMTTKAMASAAARIFMAAESIKGDHRLVLTYVGDKRRRGSGGRGAKLIAGIAEGQRSAEE